MLNDLFAKIDRNLSLGEGYAGAEDQADFQKITPIPGKDPENLQETLAVLGKDISELNQLLAFNLSETFQKRQVEIHNRYSYLIVKFNFVYIFELIDSYSRNCREHKGVPSPEHLNRIRRLIDHLTEDYRIAASKQLASTRVYISVPQDLCYLNRYFEKVQGECNSIYWIEREKAQMEFQRQRLERQQIERESQLREQRKEKENERYLANQMKKLSLSSNFFFQRNQSGYSEWDDSTYKHPVNRPK